MSLFEPDALASAEADTKRPLAERLAPRRTRRFRWPGTHPRARQTPARATGSRRAAVPLFSGVRPESARLRLARLIAGMTRCDFIPFSAVLSGIKEIKAVMADAERSRRLGRRTVIFVDEIHRFNKAQQDAFLPYVERGDVMLIGATTENPSFEVISALLSRAKVYALRPLTEP